MLPNEFVHLNVHTEYSLKDSLIRVPKLISSVKSKGMNAVAVSDSCNMFATIKHYKKSISSGVKPIIAMEVNINMKDQADNQIGKMILIAKNNVGYKNLTQLISDAYENGNINTGRNPIISIDELSQLSEGVIALSGARHGSIGKLLLSGDLDIARMRTERMKSIFGDRFFLELQRTGHELDDKHVHAAVRLASQANIPVVATNGALFLEHNEFRTHQIRTAIAESKSLTQIADYNINGHMPDQYLKSPDEMANLFSDIPSAIQNTVAIAKQCSVEIVLGKYFLPDFPDAKAANMTEAEFLTKESYQGLESRLEELFDRNASNYSEKRKEYFERLDVELKTVIKMGFPGYFLIVSDFIQWSRVNEIPVGPGRGSGAGSLIAYALKITDLDPLEYTLLFERFLNPERVSMPDFDIDFCMDRREEVIKYNSIKYGQDAVSQIITYGTMAAKMVVRDVSRALGFPFSVGGRISNFIPNTPGIKLAEAIELNPDFKLAIETDNDIKTIISHSLLMEGLVRQTGKHAGGVVISKGPLTGFTPTYNEFSKQGEVINKVSQFDKNDVEDAGLVKFDFLGLKTLTIIQNTINLVNKDKAKQNLPLIDIRKIKLDEPEVYRMFQEGRTSAVFQVESKGMKDLNVRLKPDCFEDLISLIALFRPGPLESGMVDNFINRKHGREEISYPDATYQHECLKEILESTYGVILFQEQVMKIAQVMAGYTLGEADMLRRAMGKKKLEDMMLQRDIFKQGAKKNGISSELSMKIFDLVEKFAGYGFNKSHSAAYARISYETAWLKHFYPSYFMSAVLSADMGNTEKIVAYVNECRSMGIEILPPDVNISLKSFTPKNDNQIVFGLGGIKGIGDSAIAQIIDKRDEEGGYKNLFDFCISARPNKRVLEAGVYAGLFDNIGPSRAIMMETIPSAIDVAKFIAKKNLSNSTQMGMFGELAEDESVVKYKEAKEWNDLERLSGERQKLGMYLTGHPIDFYEKELSPIVSGKLIDLMGSDMEDGNDEKGEESAEENVKVKWENKKVTIAAIIVDMEIKSGAKGQTAYLKIDDKSKQTDLVIYNKFYHECQHLLEVDKALIIEGTLRMDNRSKKVRMFANSVKSVDMVRERMAETIHIDLDLSQFNTTSQRSRLNDLIKSLPEGYARLEASFVDNEGVNQTKVLGSNRFKITDDLIGELQDIFGKNNINIKYKEKSATGAYITPKVSKEQKEALISEGQRTFEDRSVRMAEMFNIAEAEMDFGR
ncbi:DNA polymerase III subunit alpha [Psychromonas sp. SP041]|uniref:DNA polymerase III subunit alpha n=1 Tax=Psychromonas sp. SP041 TaxID=1365007 RepID=UPI0010C7C04E|nr:DNA polymerase III subunit alpha [Psychromonas sp. SP041]